MDVWNFVSVCVWMGGGVYSPRASWVNVIVFNMLLTHPWAKPHPPCDPLCTINNTNHIYLPSCWTSSRQASFGQVFSNWFMLNPSPRSLSVMFLFLWTRVSFRWGGHRSHSAVQDGEGRDCVRHCVRQQTWDHQPGRSHAYHRLSHQGLRGGSPQDQSERSEALVSAMITWLILDLVSRRLWLYSIIN